MPSPDSKFDPLIDALPARYVVGIDLGTTNSAVTYVDTEESPWQIRILLIPQHVAAVEVESLDTLPSFYFQPPASQEFFVGAYARDETAKTSGRGIASAKSWLCHSAVDRTAGILPWHGAADVQRLSPVEVSGAFLRHVRIAWDKQFPQHGLADQDVVLTLPASFDEVARELTVEAAAQAGLPSVLLIEEPQAAFYAWVYKHDADWESRVEVGQKILVCDIGGGTSDFTLIRVRQSEAGSSGLDRTNRIQFHRVAVGNHLILGGDNLDLAIAKHIEQKLTGGGRLESYQWDVLVGTSRNVKEQLLSDDGADSITVSLPSRGSKLIGGSLQTDVGRDEIRQLILDGFLPSVLLTATPRQHQSGFQEFGLPYASDAAISRYLAQFLVTHATAGLERDAQKSGDRLNACPTAARPDVVLFNGGFFASPVLRDRVVEQISNWFQTDLQSDWQPVILENDRLDLAVARGAAYYGMVRRDQGVRIAATLARSYYIGVGGEPEKAICIMPGSAEPGQKFSLSELVFKLTISQPVEFSLFVSSIRLADQAGEIVAVDSEQMTALPPIRTVLKTKSRNEKQDLSVRLEIALTEIGTLDLSCHEINSQRSWKLQFDVRSTTQTDRQEHLGLGESQGVVDDELWQECEPLIVDVFSESETDSTDGKSPHPAPHPKSLVNALAEKIAAPRGEWPMSFLRRIWESLMEHESGRAKSAQHEARWLNLLGYSLRPGYGVALDDWRVTETWRAVNGKSHFAGANVRNENLILWRRLAGGLTRGQQSALAEPWLAALRGLAKQMSGRPLKGNVVPLRPEDSMEVWRLLGSLEWLTLDQKQEVGDLIVAIKDKPKLSNARDSMIWALGRLGQRRPLYGPLNTVLPIETVQPWIRALRRSKQDSAIGQLAVVQMSRRTDDRYRDLDEADHSAVLEWLRAQHASEHLIQLVRQVGAFDAEEQGRVFGEALPPGLRLEN